MYLNKAENHQNLKKTEVDDLLPLLHELTGRLWKDVNIFFHLRLLSSWSYFINTDNA